VEPSYDTLVLGGGTAGCVLAARLSEDPARTVCLVEAGPDYGPHDSGSWPAELLDARNLADSHDWHPGGEMSHARARVIGGCSAHNAAFLTWGHPSDYDEWGGSADGWEFESFEPYLRRALETLGARRLEPEEIGPWSATLTAAAETAGFPTEGDFNDAASDRSAAPIRVNIRGSTRWSTGFAYLDPARERPNLTVLGDVIAERVALDGSRVTGAGLRRGGEALELGARLVIVSAGAYGSPSILLRSGVGPGRELEEAGVRPAVDRPGVGSNLIDHPGVNVSFGAGAELAERLSEQDANGRMIRGGAVIRLASRACAPGASDLHLLGWAAPDAEGVTSSSWRVQLSPYALKPASRGRVRLSSAEPDRPPAIDSGFLTDPEGADLEILAEGLEAARDLVAASPAGAAVAEEAVPGAGVSGREAIADFVRENVRGYFHPVGTCRMGASADPDAVVDGGGRVHGVEGLRVCDASIMPTIPRANTNLTTVAIAERIAASIKRGDDG
jgi:choline dehydrogenase-like flavoprotein